MVVPVSDTVTLVHGAGVPASDTVAVVPDRVNEPVSSSLVVTVTVWSASGSKLLSEEASTIETVTVVTWSPSMRLSSMPVTVTV